MLSAPVRRSSCRLEWAQGGRGLYPLLNLAERMGPGISSSAVPARPGAGSRYRRNANGSKPGWRRNDQGGDQLYRRPPKQSKCHHRCSINSLERKRRQYFLLFPRGESKRGCFQKTGLIEQPLASSGSASRLRQSRHSAPPIRPHGTTADPVAVAWLNDDSSSIPIAMQFQHNGIVFHDKDRI